MKKFLFTFLFLLTFFSYAYSQIGNETITITTYYPSPYGVYKNLEMYPSDEPTVGVKPGVMYFNKYNDTLLIYVNDTAEWQPVGKGQTASIYPDGIIVHNRTDNLFYEYNLTSNNFTQITIGGGGNYTGNMLVNGAHTESDCTSAVPPGEVVDSDVGLKQCRFTRSSCPSEWTKYKDFSTTTPRSGQGGDDPDHPCIPSCTTSSHSWENHPVETCRYPCGCPAVTCACTCTQHAAVTQIGCY